MKKRILSLLACMPLWVMASHIVGGQISTNDIGNNQHQVRLKLWIDSTSIVATTVPYSVQNGGATTSYVASLSSNTAIGNGIAELLYLDTIPTNAMGAYKLVYQHCCRNGAIVNVTNSSTQDFYIESLFNYDPTLTNSTPEFINTPAIISGVNDTLIHNPLAVDADGDSLVFAYKTPLGSMGATLPMTFLPYPSGAWAFTVDALSGEISWIPSMTGDYVYAVEVKEYRNGNLLSTNMRDMTVKICVGCKTTWSNEMIIDKSSWTKVGNYYTFNATEGVALTINFSAMVSLVNMNQLSLKMVGEPNIHLNAPTFNPTQTTSSISGTYTWTPTLQQVRTRPYLNVLVAEEKNMFNERRRRENTILFKVNAKPSGIDNAAKEHIKIYPNPASDVLFVEVNKESDSYQQLELINTLGEQVLKVSLSDNNGTELVALPVSNLAKGMYLITISNKGDKVVKRIVLN